MELCSILRLTRVQFDRVIIINTRILTLLLFTPKKKFFELQSAKNLEMITRIFFSQRRKMLKKPFNQVFKNPKEVSKKFNIDLNLRPQNLDPEIYFNLVKEYESLSS